MSSINADNGVISGITGIRTTADNTGNLALQSNGVTVLTLATNNTATFANTISISGATSGAVTLAVPAVAGTNTVTIAAQTGTLNAAGPAFSAYAGTTTSITNATNTKITFNTEEFDTNNNFDSSRFTPTVAGYYQINACVYTPAGPLELVIYKSGVVYKAGAFLPALIGIGSVAAISSLVYCNGSTDYIEIYAYQSSGTTTTAQALQDYTYFNGSLVRGA